MKTVVRPFKSAATVFAAVLVIGLMASLSYAATGGFHQDRQTHAASSNEEPTECTPTDGGDAEEGTSEEGTTENGDTGEEDTTENADGDDQGEDCETEDTSDEGTNEDEGDDGQQQTTTDPERKAACNQAAGIDPKASHPVEGEKAKGLDNAIQHVLANCMKNEKAPGLLNALEHLVANRERHELHDQWKAEHEHGKPPWAGGGPPPWAGGGS